MEQTLGKRIKEARIALKMTQSELVGDFITRNMLSQIEQGKAVPSVKTLGYLASRLGVTAGELMSGASPRFSAAETEKEQNSSISSVSEADAASPEQLLSKGDAFLSDGGWLVLRGVDAAVGGNETLAAALGTVAASLGRDDVETLLLTLSSACDAHPRHRERKNPFSDVAAALSVCRNSLDGRVYAVAVSRAEAAAEAADDYRSALEISRLITVNQ